MCGVRLVCVVVGLISDGVLSVWCQVSVYSNGSDFRLSVECVVSGWFV